jgi:polyisoprenoid-binding protein YceI
MRKSLLGLALALLAAPLAAQGYNIDPNHTEVGFEVVHLTISHVRGHFATFSGTVDLDEKDLTKSQVTLSVDAASVLTGIEKRDNHLKSPDFFDVAADPKITFKSTAIAKTKDGYDLTGDLTIHGITKPVTLQAQLSDTIDVGAQMGGVKRGFSLRGTISRKDYQLGTKFPEAMLKDAVALVIDGELAKVVDDKK